ncbi:MAG TPA: ABC transporter permease [Steroidobacteraceae bacterium]|nr:ABC transporter permease [Steroidobacteraceae bacterium]
MLGSLLRIVALTRKELLAVLKDRRARMSLLLPPMIQTLIFGYAATYDLNHVPYAVLDQDDSGASRALIARFDGTGIFDRVADLHREADIGAFIDARRAILVLQVERNFERQLDYGAAANVQLIADGRNSNTAGTAMGYANAVIEAFNADWRATHDLPNPPVSIDERAWYNPNLETRWDMIPGMIGTLTLIQTLLLTAMSVAREREQGTFDQLLVTPFRPAEIMAGKALPAMLIGLTQATGVLLVAQLWFHIPFAGSFVTLYAGMTCFVLASVGIGLMVSAVSYTMQQAMLFSFLMIMPFAMLSGLTTPLRNMPLALQYFTLVNPLRYAVDIAQRVYLEGTSFAQLFPDIWPLALIAGVTLSGAAWMFRNRLQ